MFVSSYSRFSEGVLCRPRAHCANISYWHCEKTNITRRNPAYPEVSFSYQVVFVSLTVYDSDTQTLKSNAETQSTVFEPGWEIFPVSSPTSKRAPRPRGPGKLLSSIGNLGLALLRLEHVENVNEGLALFEMEVGVVERQAWRIVNSWPSGWPGS